MNFFQCKFYIEKKYAGDLFVFFFRRMLPTLGLISYDVLSTHPIAKYSKHVANGLSRLGTDLAEFPWDDLR